MYHTVNVSRENVILVILTFYILVLLKNISSYKHIKLMFQEKI